MENWILLTTGKLLSNKPTLFVVEQLIPHLNKTAMVSSRSQRWCSDLSQNKAAINRKLLNTASYYTAKTSIHQVNFTEKIF